MTYLYDPRTNIITETTIKQVAGITGQTEAIIQSYRSKGQRVARIGCYITHNKPTFKQREKWYAKEKHEYEVFVDVEGSNGEYKISNYGRVIHIKADGKEVMKMPHLNRGANRIQIKFLGEDKRRQVRDVVAHHFIRPKKQGEIATTKNGIKSDDYAGNLEYVSQKEHMQRIRKTGKRVVQLDAESGEYINDYRSIEEAARKLFLSRNTVWSNLNDLIKVSGGFKFLYYEDYEREMGI